MGKRIFLLSLFALALTTLSPITAFSDGVIISEQFPDSSVKAMHIENGLESTAVLIFSLPEGATLKRSFRMEKPGRIVLDFSPLRKAPTKRLSPKSNPFIDGIRIGQHPDKTRFVVDLKSTSPDVVHTAAQSANKVTVTLTALCVTPEKSSLETGQKDKTDSTNKGIIDIDDSEWEKLLATGDEKEEESTDDLGEELEQMELTPEKVKVPTPNPTPTPTPTAKPTPTTTTEVTPEPTVPTELFVDIGEKEDTETEEDEETEEKEEERDPSKPTPTLSLEEIFAPLKATPSPTPSPTPLPGKVNSAGSQKPTFIATQTLEKILFATEKESEEPIVRLLFSGRQGDFTLVKKSEQLYVMSLNGTDMESAALELAHYPPQNFFGLRAVKASLTASGIRILFSTDLDYKLEGKAVDNEVWVSVKRG